MAGLISAETANNVVLKLPGGAELPMMRSDIASQQLSSRSLMPEGTGIVLKPQDVADLIAWIRTRILVCESGSRARTSNRLI